MLHSVIVPAGADLVSRSDRGRHRLHDWKLDAGGQTHSTDFDLDYGLVLLAWPASADVFFELMALGHRTAAPSPPA